MLDRCRGRILAAWILLFLSPAAAKSQFSVEDSRLLLDGSAFVVRGVVYSNVPIGASWSDTFEASECLYARDLPLIAGLGANTILTPAMVPPGSRVFSQALAANDLYWLAGFPLDRFFDPQRSLAAGTSERNALRTEILDQFRIYVEAWKDEPRLLAFVFGNEVDVDYGRKFGGQQADFFSLLRDAAALAGEAAPGTLITTSAGNPAHIGAFNLGTNDPNQPGLSFWSVHVSGATSLEAVIQETENRTAKPFLVSAFGVDAYDPATQSEASGKQAEAARNLAQEIDLAAGNPSYRLVGGVWGALLDEWWRGGPDAARHGARAFPTADPGVEFYPAWGGLFGVARGAADGLDSLRPREAYFALARTWGGTPPGGLTVENSPRIETGGVVNAASGLEQIAPGSLFTIRGESFTSGEQASAGALDLPYQLADVSVCVEQRPAPLYWVAADEIRAQLPWETALGRRHAIVYRAGVASQPSAVEVLASAPGIFEGAVFRPGLPCPVDGANGVRPGDYIEVYGTGLGLGTAEVETGLVANETLQVTTSPQASLDDRDIDVVFSGLLAAAVGVYQTNVRVPLDIAPGVAQLRLRQNALLSNGVAVQITEQAAAPRLLLNEPEPNALLMQAGGPPAKSLVRIGGRNGFCELVRFVVEGLPAGVRASIPVGVPGQAVFLEIRAEPGAPRAEDAAVTLTAFSGLIAAQQTLRLTVLPALGDIRLRVVSGGWLSGSPRASFEVDGRVVYQVNGGGPGRGFSFLAVDSQSGVLNAARSFDTWGNEEAVAAMEVFLQSLPHGQVVLAAVADDGSLLITAETRRIVRETLGSRAIDSLGYQSSWAIISRVGASQPIAEGLMLDEVVVLDRTLTFPMP